MVLKWSQLTVEKNTLRSISIAFTVLFAQFPAANYVQKLKRMTQGLAMVVTDKRCTQSLVCVFVHMA